jgi:hypothetical protein
MSRVGHLRITHDLLDFIRSTIGVKLGCPLSSILFGIYSDEIESFFMEHIQDNVLKLRLELGIDRGSTWTWNDSDLSGFNDSVY